MFHWIWGLNIQLFSSLSTFLELWQTFEIHYSHWNKNIWSWPMFAKAKNSFTWIIASLELSLNPSNSWLQFRLYYSRYTEKHWNTKKKYAVVWDPYFLISYTPGIPKIPIWKYFMCILARNLFISDLNTEKWHEFDRKKGQF